MTSRDNVEGQSRLLLKKATNWFPAGEGFLKAMTLLSDGGFLLFVFLCLKADRRTATYRTSPEQLVAAVAKPISTIQCLLTELKTKDFCSIVVSNGLTIRINEKYWPYQAPGQVTACTGSAYVMAIRQQFLALGCANNRFGPSEEAQASNLEKRGIPLQTIRDAMIIAACRKYVSWLNNGYSEPISSISYFDSVIRELQEKPLAADYREYLPFELKRLSNSWARSLAVVPKRETPTPQGNQQPGDKSDGKRRDDAGALS